MAVANEIENEWIGGKRNAGIKHDVTPSPQAHPSLRPFTVKREELATAAPRRVRSETGWSTKEILSFRV